MKKILCILSGACLLLFSGCNQESNKIKKISVLQIVEHDSLNQAKQGFIDELKNLGYEEGKNIEFEFQNAGGDLSNCEAIANKFKSEKNDLILAISTPAAQAVSNAIKDRPILIAAVTNPEEAGLVKSNLKSETNVVGTSDLAPIKKIIELTKNIKPDIKKVGILYSSTDPSPQYQSKIAKKEIENLNLEAKMMEVSSVNDVEECTRNLIKDVEAIYVPIDKITASSISVISQIAKDSGKFVVCAEESLAGKGPVGTYGIDYYEIGRMTARQAVKILKNEEKIENMSIEYIKDSKLIIDKKVLDRLNFSSDYKILKDAKIIE